MSVAIVVRRTVVPGRAYGEYRQELRQDFYYACSYCSITEAESQAVGFQIDHYTAKENGGTDAYENLFWSCEHCNRRKSAISNIPPAYYVIRIDVEDPADHYGLDAPPRLVHKTETGRHNILVLDLNRRTLCQLRELRQRLGHASETITHGLRVLNSVRIDRLPLHVRALFMKYRERIRRDVEAFDVEYDEFIRDRCRSPFLDPDPDQTSRTKARREHLRSINAVAPRPAGPKR